ncbi:trypsin-like peptidase domain-containing protein [Streptomyces sp. NPDC046197]|uniref:trypsin-like peptidase domain-containing protein n=1 Tax=Streptomyces sp. NPDC046197 TaxID=3154337 RepID=UPI0033E2B31B
MSALEDLLRGATLALETRGPGSTDVVRGTGFLVAPGIVATCAHVLADRLEEMSGTVVWAQAATGRELVLEAPPEWYLRVDVGGLDLALLRMPLDTNLPHVLLCDVLEPGDAAWTFGHPAGQFRAGQSALFTAQGASRLRAVDAHGRSLDREWQPERVYGTPVGGGYSGSPVLSRRTGAVCGMLCSSDKAGSAHMVSAADILVALPQIAEVQVDATRNGKWFAELRDDQIRAGGWAYPGPRLRAYLQAAVLGAREHPYPGLLTEIRPRRLTGVHLDQLVRPITTHQDYGVHASSSALAPPGAMSAQGILDQDGDALVIAGPGGGKSTLLRSGLITLAERWGAGQTGGCNRAPTGRWVPVLVPAADLVLPLNLHDAIAASVEKDLSIAAPSQEWPPQLFNSEPLLGVGWLVLVDGLDEITDAETRRKLIAKLRNASHRRDSPYRFVVTTRPLPAAEMPGEQSGDWPPRRYELLPFNSEDLDRFAARWFTEVQSPEQVARDFISELRRQGLYELACTPLMATMLCQLYTDHPDQRLPDSRGKIYLAFVDLLYERQLTVGLRAQACAALQESGQDAVAEAEHMLDSLPDLIAYLAAERHAGNTAPALDLLSTQLAARRPSKVSEAKWRIFLEAALRGSGLLTLRAGEAVFLHQTLLDYLAARYHTRDQHSRLQAYGKLNHPARYRRGAIEPGVSPRVWGRRFWKPPRKHADSFVGFLIDLGYADATGSTSALDRLLMRLATQGGLEGCEFIARQARQGTWLPQSITRSAAVTLADLAREPRRLFGVWDRVKAARALAELGEQLGIDLLASLAQDPLLSGGEHVIAAEALAGLGNPRGADLLVSFTQDSSLGQCRVKAAWALAGLGDLRGLDAFALMAQDSNLDDADRLDAAEVLAGLDPRRAVKLMTGRTPQRPFEALAGVRDQLGVDLLASLAQDPSLVGWLRVRAAGALAELGDRRAAGLLALLAHNPDLRSDDRARAAELTEREFTPTRPTQW